MKQSRDSIKGPWEERPRERFLAALAHYGWRYLGQDHLQADLFQLGDTKLAVDQYGAFLYFRNPNYNRWERQCGISDTIIDASYVLRRSHFIWPISLDGNRRKNGDYVLDLRTGELLPETRRP